MTWSRLDDTLHGHPKATEAGLEAMGLWVLALSHCGAYLTDGHVKRSAAARLAGTDLERLSGRLVAVGLWVVHPSGDGWQVHDFLAFNPSREHVLAERETKRAAGQKGAASAWAKRKGMAPVTAPAMGADMAPASALPSESGMLPSRPDPVPSRPDPEEREIAPSAPLTLTGEPRRTAAKRVKKHTDAEIAVQRDLLEHFTQAFESVKGCRPKNLDAGDVAAAFKLANVYGADEAKAIIDRAFQDTFVVEKNATLKFIASKADTFRGTSGPKSRTPVQEKGAWASLAGKQVQ